jgi:ABC-2 type transport system ATP-binding protein
MNSETLIKIDNVHKSYAGGFQALKGVNLEIKRGEILALLGPNGAGKTTLINAICGVVIPHQEKLRLTAMMWLKIFVIRDL